VGSFEKDYSNDVLAGFTAEQRKQLQMLHRQLDTKYEAIARLLANEIGLPETAVEGYSAAEEAIKRWGIDYRIQAKTLLQTLLSEHSKIAGQITMVWDDIAER
jgi:hypothetical protein